MQWLAQNEVAQQIAVTGTSGADQAEIDRLWAALSQGGSIEQCGWLKDRYGVSWQIVPTVLGEMMKDSGRARARRVAEAMLKMVKIDIAALKKAYDCG